MRECKWCKTDISNKRKDAFFCKRTCKGMYSRKKKIERIKNERM